MQQEKPTLLFTVSICTFNRSDSLKRALKSLSMCLKPQANWELIVVDNNSTDDTKSTAHLFAEILPMRYIFEGIQGLSSARNRALEESQGDFILFTDDDLVFDDGWLLSYEKAFVEHSNASWFGGRVNPLWDTDKPRWLKDEKLSLISGLLVHYDLGTENREYEATDLIPYGASFALKRDGLKEIGIFRLDLGVKGHVVARGEEAEYIERLVNAGNIGFYVGTSLAFHVQDFERFTWQYMYEYGVQKGIADHKLTASQANNCSLVFKAFVFFIKAILQILKGRGDRARQCVINIGILKGQYTSELLSQKHG